MTEPECPECGCLHDQTECRATAAACDCCAAIDREEAR